jgi:hypothetical protein
VFALEQRALLWREYFLAKTLSADDVEAVQMG